MNFKIEDCKNQWNEKIIFPVRTNTTRRLQKAQIRLEIIAESISDKGVLAQLDEVKDAIAEAIDNLN